MQLKLKNEKRVFASVDALGPSQQFFIHVGMFSCLPGSEVIKLFSYSTQLSMNFILLINVKKPTRVSILTFMSRINTTHVTYKRKDLSTFQHFSFYEQLKVHAQLS